MADCIDQNNLPGVQVVRRDFAVLEDHSLAHSLQEQEIENHLASNVCRSRRTQEDLRIAKQLQEEEDLRARARLQQLLRDTERTDGEMAVGMQEQLVRQAQQLRWQEEKDKAMARRLQEKEVMAQRKRGKEKGAAFDEGLFQEKGVRNPKSGPLSVHHGSSRKQQAPPDTDSALQKKEKPDRPPPPQCYKPSVKAQHQGHGDLTEPVDRGSQTIQAVSDVPGPQRASAAWEGVTAVVSGWDHPPLLGSQRSSPSLPGGGKTWNTQEELLVSLSSNDSLEDTRPSSGGTGRKTQLHGFMEITQGMEHLALREQELQDFEIAKRFQMEEMMASSFIKSAGQVAQDKEMAWKIMEEEEKKLTPDEVMRQMPVEECNYQRPQSQTPGRPARPPLPLHSYRSAESSYLYSRGSASPGSSPQLPARPAAPARGSHYRQ